MRWFKHDAYSFVNPKLRKLRKKYGFISYGFFYYILEDLSKYGEDCCLSLKKLTIEEMVEDTGLDEGKIRGMLAEMANINLMDKTRYDSDHVIFIPKFTEYFDDYSKRVQRVVSVGKSTNTSVSVDKIREEKNREEEIISAWNQSCLKS
jgi:hypothetical protein